MPLPTEHAESALRHYALKPFEVTLLQSDRQLVFNVVENPNPGDAEWVRQTPRWLRVENATKPSRAQRH